MSAERPTETPAHQPARRHPRRRARRVGGRPGGRRHPRRLGRRRRQDRAAERRPGAHVRPRCSAATCDATRRSSSTTAASAASCSTSTHRGGAAIALELIAGADVFVTNIRAAGARRGSASAPRRCCARNPAARLRARSPATASTAPTPTGRRTTSPRSGRAPGIAAALTPPGGALPFQRGGMGDHTVAMTAAGDDQRRAVRAGAHRARASSCRPRCCARARTRSASTSTSR